MEPQPFPNERTTLRIPGPVGQLECLVEWPDLVQRTAVGVVCAPHPQFDGTMHNKVVYTLAQAFRELGMPSVRFNYRGVGANEGEYDNGVGESEDTLAMLNWVQQTNPGAELWVAGFSFGGYASLRAVQGLVVSRLALIAPAVENFVFDGLVLPDAPCLVLQGDEDEIVSHQAVWDWAQSQQPQPNLVAMTGAGHFFHGMLPALREQVVSWAKS